MSNQKVIRVGVIGAGRIGKIHAENLATRIPGVVVSAIADINQQAAQALAEKLHVANAFSDYRKIIEDKDIDAVAVCSSTDTHADLIIAAANAGKHVFCEKPVDHSLDRIDKAINAVSKAGVQCQIGFNRRFDPNFKKLHDLVQTGKIGDLHILRITSRDPAPPPAEYVKLSGGMFLDMTIHDFDMARFLSGSEVEEVYAIGEVRVDPAIGAAGDIDTAVITLKFANGAIGTIDNSRKAVYGYDQRAEVFGSGGMAATANNTPNSSVYSNADGVVSEKPLYFFLERYMESFVAEMRDFINAIREGNPTPVNVFDGRKPVVIAMAATRSMLENRPVKLSEIE
ncbi:MAG TPA: inositol 2-dehydrogenase [Anaerolineaceae bacterium]|jgi:myo-inositol 2-dehydrogenase/D-chiro-inositol 1-dehydrogenase|nr:inositol 2-dehydrogenase [Anaerolineaceae bacterium]NMC17697.1 inositol 2-dehydrogenase [Chloroflexota bacterium]HNS07057.1 inositol 2-dehydrogenase [Anaerolineaceae bacterium]HNW13957.1 inositol 2-dehydrogenase [Anaerolineaceae bacterium]HOE01858.1 inositol 2-dehydrogenase [Anaerolineaceae bacterium]